MCEYADEKIHELLASTPPSAYPPICISRHSYIRTSLHPHIPAFAYPHILTPSHYQNFHIPANYFRIFFASNLLYLN